MLIFLLITLTTCFDIESVEPTKRQEVIELMEESGQEFTIEAFTKTLEEINQ